MEPQRGVENFHRAHQASNNCTYWVCKRTWPCFSVTGKGCTFQTTQEPNLHYRLDRVSSSKQASKQALPTPAMCASPRNTQNQSGTSFEVCQCFICCFWVIVEKCILEKRLFSLDWFDYICQKCTTCIIPSSRGKFWSCDSWFSYRRVPRLFWVQYWMVIDFSRCFPPFVGCSLEEILWMIKIYHWEVNLNNGKLDGMWEALMRAGVDSMMILRCMCLHFNVVLGKWGWKLEIMVVWCRIHLMISIFFF